MIFESEIGSKKGVVNIYDRRKDNLNIIIYKCSFKLDFN